ncbi:MAG TPA: hypothetical protein VEB86_12370, partial [Chryseosolibacter sp.]|nr:hypothetical protein [Chryseosolibacter sp.]
KDLSLPNLTHHGELSNAEVRTILPHAHLGISFQRDTEISKNSFPSKVFEFIGAGIPSIITPISEAGDFVDEHQLGFQFNPDEKRRIFEAIRRLATDEAEYQRFKQNVLAVRDSLSRKNASEDFSRKLHHLIESQATKTSNGLTPSNAA